MATPVKAMDQLNHPRADGVDSVRPNILILLAEDLGYNDAGSMGSPDTCTPASAGLPLVK